MYILEVIQCRRHHSNAISNKSDDIEGCIANKRTSIKILWICKRSVHYSLNESVLICVKWLHK